MTKRDSWNKNIDVYVSTMNECNNSSHYTLRLFITDWLKLWFNWDIDKGLFGLNHRSVTAAADTV